MHKTIALVFLIFHQVSSENCDTQTKHNLTVFKTIDSDGENFTSTKAIHLSQDAFHLLIVGESLPKICKNLVKIDNELSVLQIINSSVSAIDPGAFHIVPTLTLLKISFNLLTTIKTGVFNSIKVKEIDLSRNFISSIEENAFDNISNLEIVKLNYNNLKEINSNWFRNAAVYKLSVIYNEIVEIQGEAFKNMAKHRALKLRLSANRIARLDAGAFKGFDNIDILRLNGNKLEEIPEEVFANRSVRILQINTNALKCLPESLQRSGVRSLAFSENTRFDCGCLRKVRKFVEENDVEVVYPSIICEDRTREVNLVFSYNKTYEIPIIKA